MDAREGCLRGALKSEAQDMLEGDDGRWMLDAGRQLLDAGCWMLDAVCWMLDANAGRWMGAGFLISGNRGRTARVPARAHQTANQDGDSEWLPKCVKLE